MSVFPLSFSRMQVFEQCELRFDYQYVTKSHKDAGSDASRFGNRVHDAFEKYCLGVEALPPSLEKFAPLLDKLNAMPGDKYFEMQMGVTADKTPCGWDDPACWQRGIADFAVVDTVTGTGFAGDWKTGKPKDDTQQLKLMAAFLFEHFPTLYEVRTKYFWLFHPTAPSDTITYTRDMLPDLWAHFEKKSTAIVSAVEHGVFKAKPSGLCPWCPAYETCPSARRRR
jgi:RecB family exonuclease